VTDDPTAACVEATEDELRVILQLRRLREIQVVLWRQYDRTWSCVVIGLGDVPRLQVPGGAPEVQVIAYSDPSEDGAEYACYDVWLASDDSDDLDEPNVTKARAIERLLLTAEP
jgi:hypothetical protein